MAKRLTEDDKTRTIGTYWVEERPSLQPDSRFIAVWRDTGRYVIRTADGSKKYRRFYGSDRDNIIRRIKQHVPDAIYDDATPDEAPEVRDARDTVAFQAGRRRPGQGFRMNVEQRMAIERHAMEMAKVHYKTGGWTTVEDVSLRKSYDLHCSRTDGSELRVEVKGTTGKGETVLLTPNEVLHAHEQHPAVALFIVANIALASEDGRSTTAGGDVIVYEPWELDDERLAAIGYEYTVPKK